MFRFGVYMLCSLHQIVADMHHEFVLKFLHSEYVFTLRIAFSASDGALGSLYRSL
jgi:hypothetical protein